MLATGTEHSLALSTSAPRSNGTHGTQIRSRAPGIESYIASGTLRGIEAKEHVFTEGDAKTFVYIVVTGAVCLYKILPDGRRQVIDFALPGDLIGLGAGQTEGLNAQATVATRVRCVPVASLRQAASHDPQLAMRLIEALTAELDGLREHLTCIGQRSATERLVTFLLTLSHRNAAKGADPETIELRMTRADIGDFLGLTIETVSRTFSKLKALGLIEIDQGTTIRLADIDELEAMAGGQTSH